MKKIILFIVFCLSLNVYNSLGQVQYDLNENLKYKVEKLSKVDFHGETESLDKILARKIKSKPNGKTAKIGIHNKANWPQHKILNNNALPTGVDPVLQLGGVTSTGVSISQNFDGQDYTGVNPADASVGVGPNHIVQMVNSAFGSLIEIFDKNGNSLAGPFTLDSVTGIDGLGDPLVIFDQLADRWIFTEIGLAPNTISYAISTSSNPLSSYFVYSFNTASFPDYQKWSVWPNGYYITTHEDPNVIYVLERDKIIGGFANVQLVQFNVPAVTGIDFHSAAPVNFSGYNLPPNTEPPWVIRLMDDAWDVNINNDYLEMWALVVDWNNLNNSFIGGPININTAPFNSDLCGFNNYECVEQPGSTVRLDPIKEMLMHQVQYRNMGSYQSMVMAHTVDVNNADKAGIRWYELRNTTGSNWFIHQQGTYSPDGDGRFLPSIHMSSAGDIVLAYNVSGPNSFPSLRATGRMANDPLNTMSASEQVIVNGTAANFTNRYGDYNHMMMDPIDDDLFYFTGTYNKSDRWSTRISALKISQAVLAAQILSVNGINLETHNELKIKIADINQVQEVEVWKRSGTMEEFELLNYFDPSEMISKEFVFQDHDIDGSNLWYYKFRIADDTEEGTWSEVIAISRKESKDLDFEILPNPFDQNVIVNISGIIKESGYNLEIHNMLGQRVLKEEIMPNQNHLVISTSELNSGMYLLRITNNGVEIKYQKLIKS